MVEEGVSEEELEKAKKYVAGSYAIANLDTSAKIARVLVAIQREKLGLDYIDTRESQIAAVSVEDVNRMARQLLDVDPTVIVVRPPEQPADTDGQAEKLSQ
jgi:zinc protease